MGEIIEFKKFTKSPRHRVRMPPSTNIDRKRVRQLRIACKISACFEDYDTVDDCVAALKEVIEFMEMKFEA